MANMLFTVMSTCTWGWHSHATLALALQIRLVMQQYVTTLLATANPALLRVLYTSCQLTHKPNEYVKPSA